MTEGDVRWGLLQVVGGRW